MILTQHYKIDSLNRYFSYQSTSLNYISLYVYNFNIFQNALFP